MLAGRRARRLARRSRRRLPRPVPGVQGVQDRLPGQRRHGHLQGRVPLALLRPPAASARRVRHGPDLLVVAHRTKAPRVVNALAHAPGAVGLVKKAGGVAADRTIPRFASPTFTDWFRARARPADPVREPIGPRRVRRLGHHEVPRFVAETLLDASMRHGAGENRVHPHGNDAPLVTDRVVLWPDTFNNYLESPVLQAAVEVLEDAGYTRRDPAASAVLRPAAVRLRHARHRRAAVAPDDPHAAPVDPCRGTRGRSRTELRRRVPRRARQPVPARRRRPAALRADVPALGVPRASALPASTARTPRATSTATAITRRSSGWTPRSRC